MDFDRIMAVVSAARAWRAECSDLSIVWPADARLMEAIDQLERPGAMLPRVVESRLMHSEGQITYIGCGNIDGRTFRVIIENPMSRASFDHTFSREEMLRLFEVVGTALQAWGPVDLTPLPSPATLGAAAEQAPQTQGEVPHDQHDRGRHAAAD